MQSARASIIDGAVEGLDSQKGGVVAIEAAG